MRKFSLFFALLALLALAITPSFAQDEDPGTIADIVVASATAEEPEFATLLAAVQAADPSVLEALSDPEATLTVFAPTDAAFAELAEAIGEEAFNAVLADTEALTAILLYHVLGEVVTSADVVTALESEDGGPISGPTLNGQYIDIEGSVEDGIYVDDAGLVLEMVDIEASNGVIHVIDTVLLPEDRTIAEIVLDAAGMGMMEDDMEMEAEATEEAMEEDMMEMEDEGPEFTILLTAIEAADPAVLELLNDPEATLTVFAPTDAAFAALIEALGEDAFNAIVADTAALTSILQYHVVADVVYSGDLVDLLLSDAGTVNDDGTVSIEVETALGAIVTISAGDAGVFINDAEIILTDIDAVNGVIHVIDAVLVPATE